MNSLDPYDMARSPCSASGAVPESGQSLNDEVTQVMGNIGRFWKQSQTVLANAKKDLGDVVVQAQRELSKLTTTKNDPEAATPSETAGSSQSTKPDASTSSLAEISSTPPTNTKTLFSRLQSALPPNIAATVHNNVPESLRHVSENIDITQLRTNLMTEFQRVQEVTRAQAGEYAHKSEVLLREVVKEAGEVLRDAVKVIPPEEAGNASSSGLIWDSSNSGVQNPDGAEHTDSARGRRSSESQRAGVSRAEQLLKRLRNDPTMLRQDPEANKTSRDQYDAWLTAEVNMNIEDRDNIGEDQEWNKKILRCLQDTENGDSLKNLESRLVPSEMTRGVFWKRFFFREHQIYQEAEKRKTLIHGSVESEENFSWEDEEDDDHILKGTITETLLSKSSDHDCRGTLSTRDSSVDSFDVVSSAPPSIAGGEKRLGAKTSVDDPDSDWE